VIGAGPAGFYTVDQLLKQDFEVDLYDALPTPFGLVRTGVAPDHPKIKSVTRVYEKTAAHPGFRFFGGVMLGEDIQREDLLERYHAVVYAVGSADDNRLGIAGEDRPGSHAATEFVAWYNGHPEYADREFDLSTSRAVVIGNGNVAIDVARMLLLDPDEISITDTADHAVEALARAQVEHVTLLGRRGPAQAAFTNPELRELGELQRAEVIIDPAELELDEHSARWLEEEGDPTAKRNVELLRAYAAREIGAKTHRLELRFLRSPVEIVGDGEDGAVTALRVVCNRIEPDASGRLRAVATGVEETLRCGLVLRSIGYRGRPCRSTSAAASSATRAAASPRRTARRCPASTSSAGSSEGPAASSARTRRTRPTRSRGSSRTSPPAASTSPRCPTPMRPRRGSASASGGWSPGPAGRRSTSASAAPASRTGARA
jgi:ferredoxin--NADP+ reductase